MNPEQLKNWVCFWASQNYKHLFRKKYLYDYLFVLKCKNFNLRCFCLFLCLLVCLFVFITNFVFYHLKKSSTYGIKMWMQNESLCFLELNSRKSKRFRFDSPIALKIRFWTNTFVCMNITKCPSSVYMLVIHMSWNTCNQKVLIKTVVNFKSYPF